MNIFTVHSKSALIEHQATIEALFLECFGDRLSLEIWEWAYIENPHGEPIVSLCYDGDRLVGHYAIVPMPIQCQGKTINSFLSMTTMVSAEYRQHGLFVNLANENYKRATELGADIVIGFPNAMSTPGFRKRLNWNLPAPDYVACVSKEQLLETDIVSRLLPRNSYAFNLRNEKTREWRLSRPGAKYVWSDGILYKEFNDSIDLMYFESPNDLDRLPGNRKVNILVRSEIDELQDCKCFEYQFGGISLNTAFDPSMIIRQMCLSDVF